MLSQPDLLEFSKNIEWMEPVLEEKQQYLIISKKAKDAKKKLEYFNTGFKKLKKTSDFMEILKKHNI